MEFNLGPPPFSGLPIESRAPAKAKVPGSMHPGKSTVLVPAGVLLVALAVGCGGGKEQVTAAELVQKGDQICREQQSRFTEIQAAPLVNASDGGDQAQALHDV